MSVHKSMDTTNVSPRLSAFNVSLTDSLRRTRAKPRVGRRRGAAPLSVNSVLSALGRQNRLILAVGATDLPGKVFRRTEQVKTCRVENENDSCIDPGSTFIKRA